MKSPSNVTSEKNQPVITERTSAGLPLHITIALCYLWVWISGIIFLLVEKHNRTVRFHAWQSILIFGLLTIVFCILFLMPPVPSGIIYYLALGLWVFVITFSAYLWLLLLIRAFIGKPYTLPLIGKYAVKLLDRFPGKVVPEEQATDNYSAIVKPGPANVKSCVSCGKKIPLTAIFCPECGEKQLKEVMDKIDHLGQVIGSELADEKDRQTTTRIRKALADTVNAVTTVGEKRDPYTAGHQRRVTELAWAIAVHMGLPQAQIEGLNVAGQLHDIGKIAIPSDILNKPGLLSEGEFIVIKSHSQISYDILKTIEFPWPVAQIAYQHHERINGSGYPRGLKGEDILLEARILSVADVVEAMASHRPYRPALGIAKALEEIISNRGKLYDPAVVDACVELFNEKGFKFE
jgi:uncharacterized membrane protein